MTASTRILGLVLLILFAQEQSAEAGGNNYSTARRKAGGKVIIVDAQDRSPIARAFVASKNIPTSSGEFALRIISHWDGRFFGVSDAEGRAGMMVLPMGSVSAWKPGYDPGVVEFKIIGADTSAIQDDSGTLIIALRKTPSSRRRDVAQGAMQLFGFIMNGKVRPMMQGKLSPSEKIREELRAALIDEGGLGEGGIP